MDTVVAFAPVRTRAEISREQRSTQVRAAHMQRAIDGIYQQLKLAELRPVERLAVLCSILQEENHSAGASLPP